MRASGVPLARGVAMILSNVFFVLLAVGGECCTSRHLTNEYVVSLAVYIVVHGCTHAAK